LAESRDEMTDRPDGQKDRHQHLAVHLGRRCAVAWPQSLVELRRDHLVEHRVHLGHLAGVHLAERSGQQVGSVDAEFQASKMDCCQGGRPDAAACFGLRSAMRMDCCQAVVGAVLPSPGQLGQLGLLGPLARLAGLVRLRLRVRPQPESARQPPGQPALPLPS